MKKNQVSNYRNVFLKSNGINKENAMPVAISPTTYAKLEQIIQVMGDGKCTVDDFVENVLKLKFCESNQADYPTSEESCRERASADMGTTFNEVLNEAMKARL